MSSSLQYRILGCTLAVLATACAGRTNARKIGEPVPTASGHVIEITPDRINEMSARTAWEIVRRGAPLLSLDRVESRSNLMTNRPHTDGVPLLIVDGMPVQDVRYLNQLPAQSVYSIRVIRAPDSFSIYGSQASAGAIEVTTRR